MTKGFSVDTKKLHAVSLKITKLLQEIGNDDATPGTPHSLQQNGSSIGAPTATFWGGDPDNFFAKIYGEEMTYVNDTYTTLTTQLGNVQRACDGTVSQYSTQEQNAKTDVTSGHTQL